MASKAIPLAATARKGMISVAVLSTISLTALYGMLLYVCGLAVVARVSSSTTRKHEARARLDFLRTSFGMLFINLAIADSLQDLAFALDWVHLARGASVSPAPFCTAQGVIIQLGAVASTFINLMIALQTLSVLMLKDRCPRSLIVGGVIGMWILDLGLALISPIVLGAWGGEKPFYVWTGAWCWISNEYERYRLGLHYGFVFFTIAATAVIYGMLYFHLRCHARQVHESKVSLHGVVVNATSQRQKQIERIARRMLLYPIAYCILRLPLSIYRLSGFHDHIPRLAFLSVCGSIWCLSGIVDMILFGVMRNVLRPSPGRRLSKGGQEESLEVHVVCETETIVIADAPVVVGAGGSTKRCPEYHLEGLSAQSWDGSKSREKRVSSTSSG